MNELLPVLVALFGAVTILRLRGKAPRKASW